LVEHIKRYYPETFQDFNEASFGSLMLDMVSYVGDVLSFYLDYQANECFLDTAIEYNNIVKISKQLGYKFRTAASSTGILSFYAVVPATATGYGPDPDYIPILKKGSEILSTGGAKYLLNEDIDFSRENNEIIVARTDSDSGAPLEYAIKTYGQVVSGIISVEEVTVGNFQKLLRIPLESNRIVEIISVFDSEGHEYYEVDYLSQDVIYREILNPTSDTTEPTVRLRPQVVPRRFIVEEADGVLYLQFGYGSESSIREETLTRASEITLKFHGKNYSTSTNFDPSNLNEMDKLGVAPASTTLRIVYRVNTATNVNSATGTVTIITNPIVDFPETGLVQNKIGAVVNSLECNNEEPILGQVARMTAGEIKRYAIDAYASQNRAVTAQDYESVVYRLPPKYGKVSRCRALQDTRSLKRNINLFVVSTNDRGLLTQTNRAVKENLKFWVNDYKMINDTLDILDAKILNIGIDYVVKSEYGFDKFQVLEKTRSGLAKYFEDLFDIGEPLYITKLQKILKDVPGVLDVMSLKIKSKQGSGYATTYFSIEASTSDDGRILYVPEDSILEVRYGAIDIAGTVK